MKKNINKTILKNMMEKKMEKMKHTRHVQNFGTNPSTTFQNHVHGAFMAEVRTSGGIGSLSEST